MSKHDIPQSDPGRQQPASSFEQPSGIEQEHCERLEGWISRIQNGETRGIESTDRLEQIALSLWAVGQGTADHAAPESSVLPEITVPTIDGYQISGLIGRGGMGVVYRAFDSQLKRYVALKVLPADKVSSEQSKKRFQIEVQAAAQLDHPSIVPVYEYGEYADGLYYSMREIDGIDLSEKLQPKNITNEEFGPPIKPTSVEYQKWVATIGNSIAEALAHSHDQLVIHRDIKPANILIDRHGKAFLSDFGLARISEGSDLTADDALLGTLRYMSPEHLESGPRPVDGRSDIYSLGITLYELLTGHAAVSETNFAAAWKQIREGRIIKPGQHNPKLDRDLETIVLKAIAVEPEQRYQSAQELADDLDRFLNVLPIQAQRANVGLRLNRWVKRNRSWVITVGVVAGSLLAVVFSSAMYNAYRSARDNQIIRERSAELLDSAGVEKLFRNDSLRAKQDFRQAADLMTSAQDVFRQQQRIAAIEAWSPQRVVDRRLEGIVLAYHDDGSRLISVKRGTSRECWLLRQQGSAEKLFDTSRRIELAAFSQDARYCAAVVGDRTNQNPEVNIYDAETGTLNTIARDLRWRITDVWFLPDQRSLLITGWGGQATIWDVNSGELVRSVKFEEIKSMVSWVFSAEMDAKRTLMAAVVNPGRVIAYTVPDLEPIWERPIEIATWRAEAMAVSPDGQWIAVGTAEEGIRIWDLPTGQELLLGNNVSGKPTVARFSPDSQYLAVGDNRGGVYVWKMPQSTDPIVPRHGVVMWHDYSIASIRFNASQQLAVAAADSVRVWRLSDNKPLTPQIPLQGRVRGVHWTYDNRLQLTLREKSIDREQQWTLPGHLTVETVREGSLLRMLSQGQPHAKQHDGGIQMDVVVSSSENAELSQYRDAVNEDMVSVNTIVVPRNTVHLAISGDQQTIGILQAKTEDSCELRFFDRRPGSPIHEAFEMSPYPAHLKFNDDGTRWITGSFDGMVRVGDVASGEMIHEIQLPNWSIDAGFLSNGEFASLCWDGRLRIWNPRGMKIAEFDHATVPDLMVHQGNDLIVASGDVLSVYQRDPNGESWKRTVEVDHQSSTIQNVAISPKGDRWVSCGSNGRTIAWKINGELIAQLPVRGPAKTCRFSDDGRWLATLNESGTINLWDSSTGHPMGPSIRGKTRIHSMEWFGDAIRFGGHDESGYWVWQLTLPENWR